MEKMVELSADDTEILDTFEKHFAQFLWAYSDASGVNYWSLMLMVVDVASGALSHVDRNDLVKFLEANVEGHKIGKNTPEITDRRRIAMRSLLEKAVLFSSDVGGRA